MFICKLIRTRAERKNINSSVVLRDKINIIYEKRFFFYLGARKGPFCHNLRERPPMSSTKQPAAAQAKEAGAKSPPAGAFTRKMTISKSGRFREKQPRRGSLFDEQGNSLFGGGEPPAQSSPRETPEPKPAALEQQTSKVMFTMAL